MTARFKDLRDLKERKEIILGIAIEYYTKTITPVSSAYIAQRYPADISSATIRNVLAELEQEGYLTHPHTSAGRVPTQRGYRYYVDHLMNEIQLLEEEKKRIKCEYERETYELEALLDKTSQVISDITNYTSIISIDGQSKKVFCRGTSFVVGYSDQDLAKIESILKELEKKEQLLEIINKDLKDRIDIFIGNEIACQNINNCSLVVSSYQTKKGPSGRIAVLGPTRMQYERVVSALDYFSELMEELF